MDLKLVHKSSIWKHAQQPATAGGGRAKQRVTKNASAGDADERGKKNFDEWGSVPLLEDGSVYRYSITIEASDDSNVSSQADND